MDASLNKRISVSISAFLSCDLRNQSRQIYV